MLKRLQDEWLQARNLLGFSTLQIIGQAAVMAVPLVVAGLFSPDMWGRYSLCEPVIFFFSALLILSAKTPFIIYANQERGQTQSIHKSFSVQCLFLAASILFFLLTLVCFSGPITRLAKIGTTELFYIALAFLAIIMKDFAGNIFMASGRRISNAFVEFAFGILTLAFIFVFYFSGWVDLRSIFLSYFIASLFVLMGSLAAINTSILLPLTFDREQFFQMLNLTLWGMAGAVSSSIINWIGTVILGHSGSIEAGGTYNLGFKFFKGFMVLTYIASSYFVPHIGEHAENASKIKAYLYSKRPKILLFGAICLGLAWFLLPIAINVFYHGKYSDSGRVIQILLIGNFVLLYTVMYYPLMAAFNIYKTLQILNITQVIIAFALNVLLIPRYALAGAAIATVLSYIYLAVATECFYRLKLKKLLNKMQ